MANTVVEAAVWDLNQPEEEREYIALVHGGSERFILIEIPNYGNGEEWPVRINVRATGVPPLALITVLRTLADGLEKNVPAG